MPRSLGRIIVFLAACIVFLCANCKKISSKAKHHHHHHSAGSHHSSITGPTHFHASNKSTSKTSIKSMNGVNIPGLEFGIDTNGQQTGSPAYPPPISQISHFLNERNSLLNAIRIPVGWQRLQVSFLFSRRIETDRLNIALFQPEIKGALNDTYLSTLDEYVDEIMRYNGIAIIDLHNVSYNLHMQSFFA